MQTQSSTAEAQWLATVERIVNVARKLYYLRGPRRTCREVTRFSIRLSQAAAKLHEIECRLPPAALQELEEGINKHVLGMVQAARTDVKQIATGRELGPYPRLHMDFMSNPIVHIANDPPHPKNWHATVDFLITEAETLFDKTQLDAPLTTPEYRWPMLVHARLLLLTEQNEQMSAEQIQQLEQRYPPPVRLLIAAAREFAVACEVADDADHDPPVKQCEEKLFDAVWDFGRALPRQAEVDRTADVLGVPLDRLGSDD